MPSAAVEKILEEIKSLNTNELQELRGLLDEVTSTKERSERRQEKEAYLHKIQTKYASLLPSSEEFLAEKREEVELEERRFRERKELK